MSKKLDIEFVRKQFEQEGYKLLSNEYVNSGQKVDYICSNGHRYSIKWNDWQQGNRCPYCSRRPPIDLNFVREKFKKANYILVSQGYENKDTKLSYICPEGHKHYISWNNWRKGARCPYCANLATSIRISGQGNPQWKGGISCEPYCDVWLDKEFKEYIKQRDCHRCINSCCSSGDPNDLTVHHIDYNKKSCGPENLITICRSCNGKANFDREWYTAWYQAIMYRRYGYKHCGGGVGL